MYPKSKKEYNLNSNIEIHKSTKDGKGWKKVYKFKF